MNKIKQIVEKVIQECDSRMCGRLTFGSGDYRIKEFGTALTRQVAKEIFEDLERECFLFLKPKNFKKIKEKWVEKVLEK